MASFWYCTEIRATRCIFLVLHRFCRIMVLFPEHMRMPVSSTSLVLHRFFQLHRRRQQTAHRLRRVSSCRFLFNLLRGTSASSGASDSFYQYAATCRVSRALRLVGLS